MPLGPILHRLGAILGFLGALGALSWRSFGGLLGWCSVVLVCFLGILSLYSRILWRVEAVMGTS